MATGLGQGRGRLGRPGQSAATLTAGAFALLGEVGVAGLTMRAVAERAGVSEAAVFHHFANKEALLWALAGEVERRESEHLMAAVAEAEGGPEALAAMLKAMVHFYREAPTLFELRYGLRLSFSARPEGAKAGRPSPLAKALFGSLEARFHSDTHRVPGRLKARSLVRLVHALALGLCQQEALDRVEGATVAAEREARLSAALKVLALALGSHS